MADVAPQRLNTHPSAECECPALAIPGHRWEPAWNVVLGAIKRVVLYFAFIRCELPMGGCIVQRCRLRAC